MIDRPRGSELSVTMERLQLARYSGVILESRSEWHSKKCSQRLREESRQERHMNSLLQGRFCLLGPSGTVISEWPVMTGYPQNLASFRNSQAFCARGYTLFAHAWQCLKSPTRTWCVDRGVGV